VFAAVPSDASVSGEGAAWSAVRAGSAGAPGAEASGPPSASSPGASTSRSGAAVATKLSCSPVPWSSSYSDLAGRTPRSAAEDPAAEGRAAEGSAGSAPEAAEDGAAADGSPVPAGRSAAEEAAVVVPGSAGTSVWSAAGRAVPAG